MDRSARDQSDAERDLEEIEALAESRRSPVLLIENQKEAPKEYQSVFRYARIKGSISPSITAATFPVS